MEIVVKSQAAVGLIVVNNFFRKYMHAITQEFIIGIALTFLFKNIHVMKFWNAENHLHDLNFGKVL